MLWRRHGTAKEKEGRPSAWDRMIEAFWKLLDEMPYSDITLMALIRRAGVNHNTFYYHFKNMASLAEAALENNLVEELPNLIISGSFGREQTHTAL